MIPKILGDFVMVYQPILNGNLYEFFSDHVAELGWRIFAIVAQVLKIISNLFWVVAGEYLSSIWHCFIQNMSFLPVELVRVEEDSIDIWHVFEVTTKFLLFFLVHNQEYFFIRGLFFYSIDNIVVSHDCGPS